MIAGAIFLLLETILPGGIVGAIGLSTLLIALFIYLGWLTSFGWAVAIWTLVVFVLLLALRPIFKHLFRGQYSKGVYEEDESLKGELVQVVENIPAGGGQGRILVRGVSWLASFVDPALSAHSGQLVRLVYRKNLVWFVELPPTGAKEKGI